MLPLLGIRQIVAGIETYIEAVLAKGFLLQHLIWKSIIFNTLTAVDALQFSSAYRA